MADEESIDVFTCECLYKAILSLLKQRREIDKNKLTGEVLTSLMQVITAIVGATHSADETIARADFVARALSISLNCTVSEKIKGEAEDKKAVEAEPESEPEPDWATILRRPKH